MRFAAVCVYGTRGMHGEIEPQEMRRKVGSNGKIDVDGDGRWADGNH